MKNLATFDGRYKYYSQLMMHIHVMMLLVRQIFMILSSVFMAAIR